MALGNRGIEAVDCPLCGPSQTTVWMNDGKPTLYVRCRTCRTVYASPRLIWSGRYPWLDTSSGAKQTGSEDACTMQEIVLEFSSFPEARYPSLKQEAALINSIVRGGRMLDIGCQTGTLYEFFSGPQWQCWGVDISMDAAKYAEKAYRAKVLTGTVHEACFPDKHFDLITMLDMFYFVDNPRTEIQEIFRIIKPGGILAIEIPGQTFHLLRSRGVLCFVLERRWTRMSTDSAYLQFFTPKGMQQLLDTEGFSVVAAKVIGSPMNFNPLIGTLSSAYCSLIRMAVRISPRFLTLSPKVLFLARRNV